MLSVCLCLCAHFSSHSIWVSITFAHPFTLPHTHMFSAHPATQQSHISGYLSLYPFLPLLSRSLYLDIFVLNNFHLLFFGPTFPACTKYSTVFFLFEHLTNLSPLHPLLFLSSLPPSLTVAHFVFFFASRAAALGLFLIKTTMCHPTRGIPLARSSALTRGSHAHTNTHTFKQTHTHTCI